MSGMLRGVARRLVLGLTLAAAVTLIPARPASAEPVGPLVRAADAWQAALGWLESLLGPAAPPTSGGAGGTSSAGVCRGDEGACVDPNG
jgi:hypothetical protein